MTFSSKINSRARPLLGTIVEIGVYSTEENRVQEVISKAFKKIENIERLMSRFRDESDVAKINRLKVNETLIISSDLMQVLELAHDISIMSGGVFSISPLSPKAGDVVKLSAGRRVKRLRSGLIDLGGIAKGYAVDRAIDYLKSAQVDSAYVNAGGDVRAFGVPHSVFVRHPTTPNKSVASVNLYDNALATSATYYGEVNAEQSGKIVNPITGQPVAPGVSVSVMASTCIVADALTKCMLMMEDKVHPILHQFDACGFWVHGDHVTSFPKQINRLPSYAN